AHRPHPGLLVAGFLLSRAAALPDALVALWLALLGKGVLEADRRLLAVAAAGLGLSAAATWVLRVVDTRGQRRFRDRVTIAPAAHGAPPPRPRAPPAPGSPSPWGRTWPASRPRWPPSPTRSGPSGWTA